MITVVYTPEGGTSPGDDVTVTGIRSVDIAPQNDRSEVQSIRCNAGIGGGGQLGAGFKIPIAHIVSITVAES